MIQIQTVAHVYVRRRAQSWWRRLLARIKRPPKVSLEWPATTVASARIRIEVGQVRIPKPAGMPDETP